MTVTFDAVANLGTATTTAGLSASFTLGGSASALCVAVGGYLAAHDYTSLTTRTVKVGTTSLSLLQVINCQNSVGFGWVELWGLIGPPTGSQTISVVENFNTTAADLNVTAISYIGASHFGTPVTNFGTATPTTSGGIVSATGARVLNVCGGFDTTFSVPSGTLRSNQPAASNNIITLLVQDQTGAATVTQTSTFSGSHGWGTVSVNLVPGNRFTVAAAQSLTVTRAAAASFVGNVFTVGAHLSLTTSSAAAVHDVPNGPPLRYMGPMDTTACVVTAAYAQGDENTFLVTPAWITQQVTSAAANLVTSDWVTQQASHYTTQTQVNDSLTAYIPTTSLGVSSGVAQLGSNGLIPGGQLPTLMTNNMAQGYDPVHDGTVFLPSDQTHTVTTENINEFIIANVEIPNPGYSWIPLPFAYVQGYSSSASSGSRLVGNHNFGLLTVTVAGTTLPLYGVGLCTDDTLPNFYVVSPSAIVTSPAVTPLNQVPLEGAQTLELGGCNWAGSQYTFSGAGLQFFVLVVPAVGG